MPTRTGFFQPRRKQLSDREHHVLKIPHRSTHIQTTRQLLLPLSQENHAPAKKRRKANDNTMNCSQGSSNHINSPRAHSAMLRASKITITSLLVVTWSTASFSSSWVQAAATLEQVALHATPEDCWSAVYGTVYDLTAYAPNHRRGGGPSRVYQMCGTDATDLYDSYHGDHKVSSSCCA